MADNTTQLVFELAECICMDVKILKEEVRSTEELYRSTAESIHAAREAIRRVEESQCNWANAIQRVNDTFLTLQESTLAMETCCKNWQDSIVTNYANTDSLNKHLQQIVRSRQSSCSQTPLPTADSDRRSHAGSPFGGLPKGYTPTPSQRIFRENSRPFRTESPSIALPNISQVPRPHSMRIDTDQPSPAESPLNGPPTRKSTTKRGLAATNRHESSNPKLLQSGTGSTETPAQPSTNQHGEERRESGATATLGRTVELVPDGEYEGPTTRANAAVNNDDVRGNVCLACLQSWEKSLNANTGRLEEGCVYNPGETDCSECIDKRRHGSQECRKILSGQSKTLRRLKREFLDVTRKRPKSIQATSFKEAVTKEIEISENTKRRKKKRTPTANESQPAAKKSRASHGRSKSVAASQSQLGKDPEVSLKLEGDALNSTN